MAPMPWGRRYGSRNSLRARIGVRVVRGNHALALERVEVRGRIVAAGARRPIRRHLASGDAG